MMHSIQQGVPVAEVQHGREQSCRSSVRECSGCSNEF